MSIALAESVKAVTESVRALTVEVGVDRVETAADAASVAKLLGKLVHQMDSHETRAVTRWEQQSTQSAERHAELMNVLRGLGNHAQEK